MGLAQKDWGELANFRAHVLTSGNNLVMRSSTERRVEEKQDGGFYENCTLKALVPVNTLHQAKN